MNEELLPCPFCGEVEDLRLSSFKYNGSCKDIVGHIYWTVECLPCDAQTGHNYDADAEIMGLTMSGREMAIASWNMRKPPKKE